MDARIHFIPWTVSFEFFGQVLRWNTRKKFYHIIHYSKAKNPILHFTKNGVIYVHGHGDPGDPAIGPGKGTIGGDLEFNEVADRLIKTGLTKQFAGSIKLYSCNSGVGGANSFAKLFARYMRIEGYTNCTYYGYQGSIDSFPDYSGHKYSDDVTKDAKGKEVYIPLGRASENRVAV